jgi:hypothetical protein
VVLTLCHVQDLAFANSVLRKLRERRIEVRLTRFVGADIFGSDRKQERDVQRLEGAGERCVVDIGKNAEPVVSTKITQAFEPVGKRRPIGNGLPNAFA